MTTLLEESTGQLTIAMSDQRLDELAFRSAAEMVAGGEPLIVIDAGGCFEPNRMTHSARIGAIDPAALMRHLHIFRAPSAEELEHLVVNDVEAALERLGIRQLLIPDLLNALYDPRIPTRQAARILGRIKSKLEGLAQTGARIVVLCRLSVDPGTRAHFLSSLRAAAALHKKCGRAETALLS